MGNLHEGHLSLGMLAREFDEEIEGTGIVVSKVDSDTRGGAMLSVRRSRAATPYQVASHRVSPRLPSNRQLTKPG